MNDFSPIRYSLAVQLSVSALASLLALIWGQEQAISLFIGTIVYIVPNLYFTHYAFRYRGADMAEWIRRSFMWGQMGKLSLAAFCFALVFRFFDGLHVASLFVGYILMIFIQCWLGRKIADSVVARADKHARR